jgi:GAF domain-containing protein
VESGNLASSLAELGQFVVSEKSLRQTLQRVAELTVRAVYGADGAGVTWMVGPKPATITAAGEFVRRIDEIQYTLGEGPCLQAYAEQEPVLIGDLAEQGPSRWPRFTPAALGHGVGGVVAAPLTVRGSRLGALNIYALQAGVFDAESAGTATVFAEHAAVVLANAEAFTRAEQAAINLGEALTSRAVIDMAKGIIMARTGCTPAQAFDQLRVISQTSDRKLRDVAADLVAEVSGGPPAQRTGSERAVGEPSEGIDR